MMVIGPKFRLNVSNFLLNVHLVTWSLFNLGSFMSIGYDWTQPVQHWCLFFMSLRWRHKGHDSVSNHQPHDCLLSRLFRRRSKKISKLRVTGLCAGNSPGTGQFPAQEASNAENVSIWWRHHVNVLCLKGVWSLMAWLVWYMGSTTTMKFSVVTFAIIVQMCSCIILIQIMYL